MAEIIVVLAAIGSALLLATLINTHIRRERRIRRYVFSKDVLGQFRDKYPQLELKDVHLVARALRQFFLAHLASGGRAVGMPSRAVDDLWHEFILDTRGYTGFCKIAFGHYFHHVPA